MQWHTILLQDWWTFSADWRILKENHPLCGRSAGAFYRGCTADHACSPFSAQLGFTIEEETRKALKVLAPNLKHVSAERIQVELVKLLMSPHPDYLRVAYEAGITAEFLPEFDACMTTSQNTPHHCYTVGEHILHSLCHVRADKVLRITMLLHDIGKPVVRKTDENGRDHFKMHGIAGEKMAAQILRRLKFDNDTIRKVTRLVKWHDDRPDGTTKAVRRAVNRIGEDLFPILSGSAAGRYAGTE